MRIVEYRPPPLCGEALRETLLTTVELLRRRRAGDIPEHYIDAYVALNWLEWRGGSLHLTITGSNICRQLSAQPS